MSINEATGGESHRAGALPVPVAPHHPPGWIASRNQQFKMKSDLMLETCLNLRRGCITLAGYCLGRAVQS
jgi:hypothetical protein